MIATDPHPHLTLFLSIWAAVGPLVGIFIGQFLTRHWQRRQWQLDNIKSETRELLVAFNALVPAYAAWARAAYLVKRTGSTMPGYGDDPSTHQEYSRKSVAFFATLRDRMFIGEKVKELQIRQQWESAMKQHEAKFDEGDLEKSVEQISAAIISIVRH